MQTDLTWTELLQYLQRRPAMWAPGGSYDGIVGIILGFDMGRNEETSVLDGFIEHQASQTAWGNYAFSALAAAKALDVDPPQLPRPMSADEERAAITQLTGDMLAYLAAQDETPS